MKSFIITAPGQKALLKERKKQKQTADGIRWDGKPAEPWHCDLPSKHARIEGGSASGDAEKNHGSLVLTNPIPLAKYLLSVFLGLSNVSDTVEETKEAEDSYCPGGVCNLVDELPLGNGFLRISEKFS